MRGGFSEKVTRFLNNFLALAIYVLHDSVRTGRQVVAREWPPSAAAARVRDWKVGNCGNFLRETSS